MAQYARTASPPLSDDTALSAYLEAHNLIRWNRSRDWPRLVAEAQRVTVAAPDFAFGHSMFALANAYEVNTAHPPDQATMVATARREVARALAIDPKDASAYFAWSLLEPNYLAREAVLLKGIAADGHPPIPYAAINNTEGELLMQLGRERDALPYIARSVALDPLSAVKAESLVRAYEAVGDDGEASDLLGQSLKRWPHHPDLQMARLVFETFYGAPAAAEAILDDPALRPAGLTTPVVEAWRSYLAAGRAPGAKLSATRAIVSAADSHTLRRPMAVMMLSQMGELGPAFAQASKGADDGGFDPRVLFLPPTAALRKDPRFWPLASQLGLTDYWRRSGRWPDVCANGGVDCPVLATESASRR
jgi:hypothetical protein